MPKPKKVLNAFTPEEVWKITGLSVPMIDYLARENYLTPFYAQGRRRLRGKVRYYSYRDLVVARLVQRLRETGVELRRLKEAVKTLSRDEAWLPDKVKAQRDERIKWLVSDGEEVLLQADDGFLDQLKPGGQRAFAFIVTLESMKTEVVNLITSKKKRALFTVENKELQFEPRAFRRKTSRR